MKSGEDWNFEKIEDIYEQIQKVATEEFNLNTYQNQLEVISSEQMLDAYCVTPDHKVLRKDLQWIPAGDVVVGDVLLGFDKEGPHRSYKNAVVTRTECCQDLVFAVELSSGHIFKVTKEHMWLVRQQKGNTSTLLWKETSQLRGENDPSGYSPSMIPKVMDVWSEDQSRNAGWISGMYDGEGDILKGSISKLSIAQNEGIVLEKLKNILTENNIKFGVYDKYDSDCKTLDILGQVKDKLKFLGTYRPERLISSLNFDALGLMKTPNWEEVVSITPIGNQQIVKITTSSGTFICDGYPMHNCSVGMPVFYPHWSFGEQFVKEREAYRRGRMGLAYEIVINSNPCIAYLMEENTMLMQTLVIAHASFGHNHFFKNNYMFTEWTDANGIIDYLVFAKQYIRKCEELYGADEVENVLDAAHALQTYGINKYKRPPHLSAAMEKAKRKERDAYNQQQLNLIWNTIPTTDKPEEVVDEDKFPTSPQENLLYFIEKNAPKLEEWKREVIRIVRQIAQYFYPQGQTQLMNEGCLVAGSLIDTPQGFVDIKELVETQYDKTVIAYNNTDFNCNMTERVSNWYKHENKPRIKIETHHGYIIHGGEDHRIKIDDKWVKLNELAIGETIPIIRGNTEQWAKVYQECPCIEPSGKKSLTEMCNDRGISYYQYNSWKNGINGNRTPTIANICVDLHHEWNNNTHLPHDSVIKSNRNKHSFPTILTEDFAYWLGLMVGDGNIYTNKYSKINFTNQDEELLDFFVEFAESNFNADCYKHKDRNHFNVGFFGKTVTENLINLGLKSGKAAENKEVPALLLKSPLSVVAAFIRGHADTDGCATNDGTVVIVSKSRKLLDVEQQLLLKMGIVSRISKQQDGCYRLYINKYDSRIFANVIGFGLYRKQKRLFDVEESSWSKSPITSTTITSITHDVGTTYDFTVDNTHQYKSSCVMNHNCATFFHYKIIHKLYDRDMLSEGAMLEFYESHSGVVRQPEAFLDDGTQNPYYGGFNVYALGWAMYKDIERIATEPTDEDREWFSGQDWVGNGDWLGTIQWAIKNFKDESFVMQFLSPKIMRDFKMFVIHDDEKDPKLEVSAIQNKQGYKEIREKLSKQYNIGYRTPDIQVTNVDRWGDRSLTLQHNRLNGRPLDTEDTVETLKHLEYLWGYNVKLESLDDKGNVRSSIDLGDEETIVDVFLEDD